MRLFFALQPDESTALAIADWRDRHAHSSGKAVPAANFHVTLSFLGQISGPALERLCNEVDATLASAGSSTHMTAAVSRNRQAGGHRALHLNTVGYWPRPGIFWLGPDAWPAELDQLAAALRKTSSSIGCKRDRNRFTPHLTLARGLESPPPKPLTTPDFNLEYTGFSLCESRRGKNGVTYASLCDWSL